MPAKKGDTSGRQAGTATAVLPSATDSAQEVLSKISNAAHVRVSVNDLVAFEYVCEKTKAWSWGLGTVAAIPGPRLVQLMLWAGSGGSEMPPEASPVSEAERAAAVRRLAELAQMRQAAEDDMEDLNKTITVQQAHYNEGRAAYEADAARAQEEAHVAKEEVKKLKEADWREIRSYVKPPDIVKLVMEAMMLALGERTLDWNYILKVIRQRTFMTRLAECDPQSLSLATRRRLRKEYLSNPRFTHQAAMEGSCALGAIQRWVAAQLATSEATVDIMDYDKARSREKKSIENMEDTLRQRRKEVEQLKDEETQLKKQLGDAPLRLEHGAPKNGAGAKNGKNGAGEGGAKPRGRAGAPPMQEDVHGAAHTWTFTDESKIVLHSSILVNYDEPASTMVTLTPEQVGMLKKALAARAAPFAEQQQADNKMKDMADDIENVRGVLADALQELADAKAALAAQDAELAAKDREVDDAKEAAAAAAKAGEPNKSGLPPAAELAKELQDKEKEVDDLKAALAEEKEKNGKPQDKKNGNNKRGGPAAIELEKEPMTNDIAHDGSMPALFHSADDRELAKIIDRLEREIRILRNESEAANFVLDGVTDTINGRADLKRYLEEA